MSNPTEPPVALTASETRFAKRLSPYIICKVGLAVNEGGTKQSSELHKESYDNYIKMASQNDLFSPKIVKKMMVSSAPRESALPGIKKLLLDVLNKPGDVSKIWTKLATLKSEFKNHLWFGDILSINVLLKSVVVLPNTQTKVVNGPKASLVSPALPDA